MSLLEVSAIGKRDGGAVILKDISFGVSPSWKVAIAGETGSGKSTLLKMIAGLAQPDSGTILFEGVRVKGPADKLIPGHARIAYLSQQYELLNNMRVEEVLEYTNNLSVEDAGRLYEVCRISHLLKRRTSQLSGGERQRIALARLLVTTPRLLLLDEPFSNLDRIHKDLLKTVIRDIGERLHVTCMLVSHDPADTLSWADEILVMKEGDIVQRGSPAEIYRRPVTEYVGALFGSYNLIAASQNRLYRELTGMIRNGKGPEVAEGREAGENRNAGEIVVGGDYRMAAKRQTTGKEAAAGKRLFIRPEDLAIRRTKTEGSEDDLLNDEGLHPQALKGIVEKLEYLGNSYEVEISVYGVPLVVRTGSGDFSRGATVLVSLFPREDRWLL